MCSASEGVGIVQETKVDLNCYTCKFAMALCPVLCTRQDKNLKFLLVIWASAELFSHTMVTFKTCLTEGMILCRGQCHPVLRYAQASFL